MTDPTTDPNDLALFIGCLPGEDSRRMVLFPEGRVLADIPSEQLDVDGYTGPDRGAAASGSLIRVLLATGWYIDEIDRPTSIWLKPGPQAAGMSRISIGDVGVTVASDAE